MLRLALHHVVVHGEQHLVVILPCNRIRNLAEIRRLIEQNQCARIARAAKELREEFDVIVPVLIAHNEVDAERLPRFALVLILPAKPLEYPFFFLIVAFRPREIIAPQELGKLKAVYHVLQCIDRSRNLFLNERKESPVLPEAALFLCGFLLRLRDPAV